MRYLVTGICGVMGSLFALEMVKRDISNQVVGFDCGKDPRHKYTAKRLKDAGVDVYDEDLRSDYFWNELQRADCVLHAAASTGIPYSGDSPDEDWDLNVDATRYVLAGLRKFPTPTVVLSSVKPYALPKKAKPVNETFPVYCEEPYAASKLAQSSLCQAHAKSYGLPIVIFRCSNLYGPAPCHGPRHGWATWFAIAAALGVPIEVQGTGNQSRDLLFSPDLNDAITRALRWVSATEPERYGETFNVGGGTMVSLNKAVSELQRWEDVVVRKGKPRKNDDAWFVTDNTKASQVLGWNPTVDFRKGLEVIYMWARGEKEQLRKVYKRWI